MKTANIRYTTYYFYQTTTHYTYSLILKSDSFTVPGVSKWGDKQDRQDCSGPVCGGAREYGITEVVKCLLHREIRIYLQFT